MSGPKHDVLLLVSKASSGLMASAQCYTHWTATEALCQLLTAVVTHTGCTRAQQHVATTIGEPFRGKKAHCGAVPCAAQICPLQQTSAMLLHPCCRELLPHRLPWAPNPIPDCIPYTCSAQTAYPTPHSMTHDPVLHTVRLAPKQHRWLLLLHLLVLLQLLPGPCTLACAPSIAASGTPCCSSGPPCTPRTWCCSH
jgi:hypothetical protein